VNVVAVRAIVLSELERAWRGAGAGVDQSGAQGRLAFTDRQRLADDLGLGSIDVVELIANIAARIDPSRQDRYLSNDLRTVGDLCRAFEAREGIGRGQSRDEDDLMMAMGRAQKRLGLRHAPSPARKNEPTE
jgi:acyl carrier protein